MDNVMIFVCVIVFSFIVSDIWHGLDKPTESEKD
jgi:hypothetical protein